jgi:hypothetical protein
MAPIVELHKDWKYTIVGGGITPSDVAYWMRSAGMPTSIKAVYSSGVSYFSAPYKLYSTDVRAWPIPTNPWTFLIVNGSYINPSPNTRIAGQTWSYGSGPSGTPVHMSAKSTILEWSTENVKNKGLRIWHEMCHACQVNVDNFFPYQNSFNNNGVPNPNTEYYNFRNWIKGTDFMRDDQVREWVNTGAVTTYYYANGKLSYSMSTNFAFEIIPVAQAFYTYMWNKYNLPWT